MGPRYINHKNNKSSFKVELRIPNDTAGKGGSS